MKRSLCLTLALAVLAVGALAGLKTPGEPYSLAPARPTAVHSRRR
ncbi:hypothetical protein ACWDBD_44095 [Streptomyces sp. NPDC001118]